MTRARLRHFLPLVLLSLALSSCDGLTLPLLAQVGVDQDTRQTISQTNDTIRMVNQTLAKGVEIGPETRQLIEHLIAQIDAFNKGGVKVDKEVLATIQRAVEVVDKGLKVGLDEPTLIAVTHFADVIDEQPEKWGAEVQSLARVLEMVGSSLAKDVAEQARMLSRQVTNDLSQLAQTAGQEVRCTVDFTGQRIDQTASQAGGRFIASILAALRPGKGTDWTEPLRSPGICTIEPSNLILSYVDGRLVAKEARTVSVSGFNFSMANLPSVSVRDEDKHVYTNLRLIPALNSSYKIEVPLQGIDFTGVKERSRIVLAFKRGANTLEFEKVLLSDNIAPPRADFDSSSRAGQLPWTVQFYDRSTGGPTSWFWTFGDATTSTLQSPVHEYKRPGKYTVTLTVTNAAGLHSKEVSAFVDVKAPPPPQAAGVGQPPSGVAPLTVAFEDRSTGNPTRVCWNFGDQTAEACGKSVSHQYGSAGTYSVVLTASDDYGGSTTALLTVRVTSPPPPPPGPVASFSLYRAAASGPWTSCSAAPPGTSATPPPSGNGNLETGAPRRAGARSIATRSPVPTQLDSPCETDTARAALPRW